MLQVRLTQQGELVKIRPMFDRTEYSKKFGRGLRGKITKFSSRSRKNMLERFSIIDKKRAGGATFITLTYASVMTNEELSFSHLRKFLKRLKYAAEISEKQPKEVALVRGSRMFFCWKKEYQDRGAIHWHVMAFGVKWLDMDWLAYTWSDVISEYMPMACSDGTTMQCPVFTRVEYCRSIKKVWYYMAKYMGKTGGEKLEQLELSNDEESARIAYAKRTGDNTCVENSSGFNIGSNLAKPEKIGRFWGWEDRKNIPYAEKEVAYVTCSWAEYMRFRRDLSNLFNHLRQTLLIDSVKMFWFYDFLSPFDMLMAGIEGKPISKCIQWDKVGRVGEHYTPECAELGA